MNTKYFVKQAHIHWMFFLTNCEYRLPTKLEFTCKSYIKSSIEQLLDHMLHSH